MLKIENVKKLFLVVLLGIIVMMLMQTTVEASSPIVIPSNGLNSIPQIPTTTNKVSNTITPTNNTINQISSANKNSSNYTNTSLPKAGVDYSVLFVIVACVISGVYAYIKIRDYNNIKY